MDALALAPTTDALTTRPARPMLDEEFGLALMEGEEILVAGRPEPAPLMGYLMANATLVCMVTIFGLPLVPLLYFVMKAFIAKHRYWVTNSRIIVTNGIIGFKARSIPLERVSDVAISCNWLERAFGLRSVIVRDMTGEAMSGARMLAVSDATGMQRDILDRIHEVNRRAPSPEGDRMLARSYREIEEDRSQSDMLELLRRIEANTRSAA